jgi:hypothetical protein
VQEADDLAFLFIVRSLIPARLRIGGDVGSGDTLSLFICSELSVGGDHSTSTRYLTHKESVIQAQIHTSISRSSSKARSP